MFNLLKKSESKKDRKEEKEEKRKPERKERKPHILRNQRTKAQSG